MRSRPRSPAYTTQGSNPRLYSTDPTHRSATHTLEPRLGQGYLIQGGVAPNEWVHCPPPGDAQAPPATQVAQVAQVSQVDQVAQVQVEWKGNDRLYKSRLCKNWLQWGSPSPDSRVALDTQLLVSTYPFYLSIYLSISLFIQLCPTHAPTPSPRAILYARPRLL